jgi:hypothetical protein
MVFQARDRADLERPDPSWQIARFRWADIRRHLDDTAEDIKSSGAHFQPEPEWIERGIAFKGKTWREVRSELQIAERQLETPFSSTFLGDPNVIDSAAATLSGAETRGARLDEALLGTLTLPNRWPSYRLYPKREQSHG